METFFDSVLAIFDALSEVKNDIVSNIDYKDNHKKLHLVLDYQKPMSQG